MTAPLKLREFRLLFTAQVASNIGDWLDYLALAVLIAYVWEDGPGALAALAVVLAVPWIAIAPFSGVLVDRWPKKLVLIGSDLARAAVVAGMIFAPNLGTLLVLAFLKVTFSTFFTPAEQATIRRVVPEDQLMAANSLSQFVLQATKVIGPALGGLLVAATSPRVAFGVDAATFLLSAIVLTFMRPIDVPREAHEEEEPHEGYWHELREGFAYVFSRRALLIAIGSFSAALFLLFCFDALSPLAFKELGVSQALFGLAVAGIGLGGVLGTIAVGRYAADWNPFALMGGAEAIVGLMVVLVGVDLLAGFDFPTVVFIPILIVVGIASAGVLIGAPTIIQLETPAELMGRVSTTANSVPTAFQMFAPLVGAALASWQSVGFVFALAGGALAALGLVVLALRPEVGVGVPAAAVAAADVSMAGTGVPTETEVRR